MRKLVLILVAIVSVASLFAQADNMQVLVFRHSGEVNLFYSSDLDSIFCSKLDTAGIEHETNVSQVFYTNDSAYVIPIADIDSVAFGNRNEMEYKSDIRILTNEDVSWIIRVEDNTIYFKPNTPSTILPKVGEKLFYPEVTDMFPTGISVTVVSVTSEANEIAVVVEMLDVAEVFERFFYAGPIENGSNQIARIKDKENFDATISLGAELPLESYGSLKTSGGLDIEGVCVIRPLKHYYHADISMNAHVGFNIELSASDSVTHTFEPSDPIYTHHFPPVAVIFVPSIDFSLFCKLKAELQFNYEMRRNYAYHIVWERKNGQNTLSSPKPDSNGKEYDEAKIDVTLNGSIFFGPQFNLNFDIIGDVGGVQVNTKIGPELSGQISASILQNISTNDYSPELYASGELSVAGKAAINAFVKAPIFCFGDENKVQFFESEYSFMKRSLHLFPEFKSSRAVKEVRIAEPTTISTTTKTETVLERPVETGFQVLDQAKQTVLDSVFVKELLPDTAVKQGVIADIELLETIDNNDTVYVRPVFHYAGYTIPHEFVSVSQGPCFMPITTYMSNGLISVASGAPVIGQVSTDSTTLHIGNYLPIPVIDTFFVDNPFAEKTGGKVINPQSLIGTWTGTLDSVQTVLTFENDSIGSLSQGMVKAFSYQLNTPQSGDAILSFADGTIRVFELSLQSLMTLTIRDKRTKETAVFTKQN